jgi:anti-sigma factor (TIGR02949 family)
MKIISSQSNYCGKIRDYLDSYLNSELLVETTHEILRHLQKCPACSEALSARERVKAALRMAVQREAASQALRGRIKKSIRGRAL